MEDTSRNPYQAPASDVTIAASAESIAHFKRFSAWAVFALSLITLGIYPLYWLYSRSKTLNGFHTRKIDGGLIMGAVVAFVVLVLAEVLIEPYAQSVLLARIDLLSNIAYLALYIILLFTFRNRLLDLTGSRLSPILTFLFGCIYLQYKINGAIDERGRSPAAA